MRRYLYLVLTGLLAAIILLAIPRKRDFRIGGDEVIEQLKGRTQIISGHKFKSLKAEVPGLRLVDIRGSEAYHQGHIEEAVNLPVRHLSKSDIYKFFNVKDASFVLYAQDTYQAEMYWILFTQMGIEGLYVLDTGVELDSLIMDLDAGYNRMILVDEIPQFSFRADTAAMF